MELAKYLWNLFQVDGFSFNETDETVREKSALIYG